MTRKHFQAVAEAIRLEVKFLEADTDAHKAVRRVAQDLATVFKQANSNFDRQRFLEACGLGD